MFALTSLIRFYIAIVLVKEIIITSIYKLICIYKYHVYISEERRCPKLSLKLKFNMHLSLYNT